MVCVSGDSGFEDTKNEDLTLLSWEKKELNRAEGVVRADKEASSALGQLLSI